MGTRASKLAQRQTTAALERIQTLLPALRFEIVPFSSPGDRDRNLDLRDSPANFFSRDLDEALGSGAIDGAVHSAKDLPDPLPKGLDGFWLPWAEDPRDCLVLPAGRTVADLPPRPRLGVSSQRRATYALEHFPSAVPLPVRGNIEMRLQQLDQGAFDLLIMAGAALLRLDLAERISAWIPLETLTPPEGQGVLAVTFRRGDRRFERLRSLFLQAATFVGAGTGAAELCTLAGVEALRRCDVCLHDALLDPALLAYLPPGARCIPVGKRAGAHSTPQAETTRAIADEIRKGRRVVRLKGGDPGLFGRLAEETEALDALALPYRVIPGVSSLNAATSATGLLLTRRGVSRGFCALTPREQGGALAEIRAAARARLPLVCFMATQVLDRVAAQLLDEGWARDTPVACVFDAGGEDETILRSTLGSLAAARDETPVQDGDIHARLSAMTAPGLCLIGSAVTDGFRRDCGALENRRVLLTCSAALQERAAARVRDFGGRPVRRPLIRLDPVAGVLEGVGDPAAYDWALLCSPSAVACLLSLLRHPASRIDLRKLPPLLACGPGTAAALKAVGLLPAAEAAETFGAQGLVELARSHLRRGQRVLRLRSDRADASLAQRLSRECGVTINDVVLYTNHRLDPGELPEFEAAVFASASAAEAFAAHWGPTALTGKTSLAIGPPTAAALQRLGLPCDCISPEATIEAVIEALAAFEINRDLGVG